MSKKLTLMNLKAKVKEYDVKEKVQLDEDTHVHIFPNFAPERIREMIKEMLSDSERAKEANLPFDINLVEWSNFNIIKFFSDLGIPSDIEKKLQAFVMLKNTDYFEAIINTFPESSMERIVKEMDRVNENIERINNMNEEDKKKLFETMNIGADDNVVLN